MNPSKSLHVATLAILGAVPLLSCSDGTGPSYDPVMIETTELKDAVSGQPYSEGVTATGGDGDYDWSVTLGTLPPGLALSEDDLSGSDDLLITGTPDGTGTYTFTLTVESGDGQTDQQRLSLLVRPGDIPLAIGNVGLPPALAGAPYSVALRPVGGPSIDYTWELVSGTLPSGLTFADGRIEGTPPATDTAELRFRLTSGIEAVEESFQLRVVAEQAGFQITAFDVVTVPSSIRPHLDAAIATWETAITGDLQPVATPGTVPETACGGFGEDVAGTAIDDVMLLVNITSIDGVGNVLGRAGYCLIRTGTIGLPAVGILTLDADDLRPLATGGTNIVEDILAHEIGHVLGFGSLWDSRDLVAGADTQDPRFTGALAVAEWQALGRSGNVPLETQGGDGTAEVHWRESMFGDELMTGFVEQPGVFMPLSRVSIASMADLGYVVDLEAADPFTLTSSLQLHGAAARHELGHDELYMGPVLVVSPDGRIVNVRSPE